MRTAIVLKLIPGLLTTTLFVACEKEPSPAAPKQALFSVQDERNSRITGGGKLEGGRDFATFGLNARPDQGHIEWVQHCLDGATNAATCSLGSFTFHESTIADYGEDGDANCRVWSGSGEAKFKDQTSPDGTFDFTAKACDSGEPGHGRDFIWFDMVSSTDMVGSTDAYHREGMLMGGNIQLHKGTPGPAATECGTGVVPT